MSSKNYSAVHSANSIIVTCHSEASPPKTIAILHDKSRLVLQENKILEIPDFGMTPRVIIDDPQYDAWHIMNAIADIVPQVTRVSRFRKYLIVSAISVLVTAALCSWWMTKSQSRVPLPESLEQPVLHKPYTAERPPLSLHTEANNNKLTSPALTFVPKEVAPEPESKTTEKEENAAAAAARQNLATVLKRNADRGMFTINLSTGHQRTLYAFLDPECINCKNLEPDLKRLASEFNIVIFPVSVIGGEKSSEQISPLLCEPDQQKRQNGWHTLFEADAGIRNPVQHPATASGSCLRAAAAAIDVNNLGFRQFGFEGTPWIITDTGYHLPSSLLKSPATVHLFLTASEPQE
ncbi:DsbC family protein [Salmonella enterica subsp. enterica serovar Legon]|nr:DsbC family protein [Salmonella enterica subsp. enterica serovar Legon]EDW9825506.1 DsbC family protein [Salmonella enterica]EDZ3589498.1 thioredoxin fold domain-containing protein [Salmonella enterica subsp. enterica serovar Wagenia]